MGPSVALRRHLDPGGEPNPLHGDWQNFFRAIWRSVPLAGKDGGDLIVGHAGAREIEKAVAHFPTSREVGDGIYPHFHFEVCHSAASPHDPDKSDVALAAVENDFLDQAPQKRLALSVCRGFVRPDLRQVSGQSDDLAVEGLAHRHLGDGLRRGSPGERLLGCPDLAQRCFPPTLELASDETIIGIDAVELAFCQSRSIPLPLELTFRAGPQRRVDLLLGSAGASAVKNA